MLVRMKYESDGKCFGLLNNCCVVMDKKEKSCGTYNCPFYKPVNCEKWVKVELGTSVNMYEPDERK